jgi:methyl-accepting chemotaxis protein
MAGALAHRGGAMTITLRLSDVLLIILTLSVAGVAVYFAVVLSRLKRVLEELERTLARAGELMPRIQTTADRAQEALGAVQRLAQEGAKAVDDVAAVTSVARQVVEESAEQVSGLLAGLRQMGTVLESFRAGWEFFARKSAAEAEEAQASEE